MFRPLADCALQYDIIGLEATEVFDLAYCSLRAVHCLSFISDCRLPHRRGEHHHSFHHNAVHNQDTSKSQQRRNPEQRGSLVVATQHHQNVNGLLDVCNSHHDSSSVWLGIIRHRVWWSSLRAKLAGYKRRGSRVFGDACYLGLWLPLEHLHSPPDQDLQENTAISCLFRGNERTANEVEGNLQRGFRRCCRFCRQLDTVLYLCHDKRIWWL